MVLILPLNHRNITKMLYAAHKKAVEERGDNDDLPLMTYLRSNTQFEDESIIQALLEANPRAAQETDFAGFTPLHWYLKSAGHHIAIVRMLVQSYPKAIKIASKEGDLPLHCILYGGPMATESVVRYLLEQYPESAKIKNEQGDFPLHCYIRSDQATAKLKNQVDRDAKYKLKSVAQGIMSTNRLKVRNHGLFLLAFSLPFICCLGFTPGKGLSEQVCQNRTRYEAGRK